jgi:hypothetical protein
MIVLKHPDRNEHVCVDSDQMDAYEGWVLVEEREDVPDHWHHPVHDHHSHEIRIAVIYYTQELTRIAADAPGCNAQNCPWIGEIAEVAGISFKEAAKMAAKYVANKSDPIRYSAAHTVVRAIRRKEIP